MRGDNTWQPISGLGGLQNVKEDLTPELGGKLETGPHTIDFTGQGSGAVFGGPSGTYANSMFIHHDASSNTSFIDDKSCLLYTSPSPRDRTRSRMPSSA